MQFRGALGVARSEIIGLADILREIVQLEPPVLVKLDQLIVARADCAGGISALIAVVRIVPVDRFAAAARPFAAAA